MEKEGLETPLKPCCASAREEGRKEGWQEGKDDCVKAVEMMNKIDMRLPFKNKLLNTPDGHEAWADGAHTFKQESLATLRAATPAADEGRKE